MRKISIALMVVLLILVGTTSAFADTGSDISTGIPESVLKKADLKVTLNKDEVPEVKAWETDLDGNTIEVNPKSIDLNVKDGISVFAPPRDGYRYMFNDYISNTARKNWYYENLGTFRVSNKTNTPINNVKYEQTAGTISEASFSANINAEARAGASFLAQVKAKLKAEAGYSRSWTKGKVYATTYSVPAQTVYYLTNYQVGLYSSGTLLYSRYHPSGANVGVYTETAGGTAVSMSDVSIELTASEPIR